jgi:hypothetical protein
MEPLTNLCFAWEVFWSRYNAKYSPEHLYTSRFARLHEVKPLLAEKAAVSVKAVAARIA